MNVNDRRWRRVLRRIACAGILVAAAPLAAQDQPGSIPPADGGGEVAAAEEILEPGEIDALVAPVVLFPDPLLALVLQASISPLDLVEAERFLLRREKDATLEPDPDWDPSVVGLLNYPQIVSSMSEYLDWTQLLGSVVVDQLDAVQLSIQGIRGAAMAQGILVSDERQNVVLVDDLIVIAPVDKSTISVPQYDPVQLLAAITPVDEVIGEAPVEAAVATDAPVPDVPVSKPEPPAAEEVAPVEEAPPAVAAPAPAPTYYAEPAPAYATAAPVYAAPPPTVSYAAPQSTFWSSAATFAGGAAVGGLLGYAWGDDDDNDNDNGDGWDDVEDAIRDLDDDDWDDFVDRIDEDDFDDFVDRLDDRDWDEARDRWNRRDINISDSTIVVGNQVKRDQLNAKLKNKRENQVKVARGERTTLDLKNGTLRREGGGKVGGLGDRAGGKRPPGLAPTNVKREARPTRPGGAAGLQGDGQNRVKRKDVRLPGVDGGKRVAAAPGRERPQPQSAGNRAQRQEQALAAARRPGAQPQVAANRKMAAGIDQPGQVRRDASRGAASKAKAGLKQGGRPKAAAQRGGGQQRVAQAQPQRRAAASANRGGGRPMGGIKSGNGAKRDSNRGKKSLGKGGGKRGRN